ncbi:hypothetical protein SEA_DEEPSOIL15_44 [Mycobacterium phage DeepSoil15]|uniref:SsDNA binding protein n=13 Tax=Caudoviricetes TaxID=2731619 RepID=A0A514A690_9CAUD|nr:hypothetical protein SEA_DEEPSOIL15_44 [Mycobacterium phage DeepSoil15]
MPPGGGRIATMNNAPKSTTVTIDGRKFVVTTYVDPHPDMHGTDRIEFKETCPRCGGTGIYEWWTAHGKGRGTCFLCLGARWVYRTRSVAAIRREAKVEAVWREHGDTLRAESAAKAAAVAAEQAAAEFAKAWDEAHAEQARRAALVTGFVAEVGAKADVIGTVTVATTFEVSSYRIRGGGDLKALVVVKLDDGRVVKATGTGQSLFDAERGARVRIRGTVREHATYKGQDQTVLTHAKITPAE